MAFVLGENGSLEVSRSFLLEIGVLDLTKLALGASTGALAPASTNLRIAAAGLGCLSSSVTLRGDSPRPLLGHAQLSWSQNSAADRTKRSFPP